MSWSSGAIHGGVQDDETARAGPGGAPGIEAACCAWAHRRTRVPLVGGWAPCVSSRKEEKEGRRREEKKEKRKRGRRKRKKGEKGKRRKRKGGAGGIRGGRRSRARYGVWSDIDARGTRRRGRWNGDWHWCRDGD